MRKEYLKLVALVALMTSFNAAEALPFDSFDPRSMAMGSTGVAVGDPATAPFFNPAMLTASDPSKKYSIELPVIGARVYDPSNMHNNLPTLSNDYTALTNSISTVNSSISNTSQLSGNYTTIAKSLTDMNNLLTVLNNQPLKAEFGAATVLGIPGNNWGFAFYADVWGAAGGTVEYSSHDASTLPLLSSTMNNAVQILGACNTTVSSCFTAANFNGNGFVNNDGTVTSTVSSISSLITSKIHIRGVAIAESGLSISHNFGANDQSWSLGLTPKVMDLQLFDTLLDANNGTSTSGLTGNDYLAKYNTVNFDMGVAKSYNNGWRTGVVVKNVVPQSFDFKAIAPGAASGSAQQTTGTLNMNPQGRFGISHENSWSTVALDVDLAKNNPAGLENKSQYAGIGGELSAWGWMQIRAGFRSDMLSKGQDLLSLGFGLSPRIPYFKPHLDLAVTASRDVLTYGFNNATQAGASLKLGFNF